MATLLMRKFVLAWYVNQDWRYVAFQFDVPTVPNAKTMSDHFDTYKTV